MVGKRSRIGHKRNKGPQGFAESSGLPPPKPMNAEGFGCDIKLTKSQRKRRKFRCVDLKKASEEELQEAADAVKKVVIRHTKSQHINGEVALALPDADCQTVFLDMSADEREAS